MSLLVFSQLQLVPCNMDNVLVIGDAGIATIVVVRERTKMEYAISERLRAFGEASGFSATFPGARLANFLLEVIPSSIPLIGRIQYPTALNEQAFQRQIQLG